MLKMARVHRQHVAISLSLVQRDSKRDDGCLPVRLDHPKRADHARVCRFFSHLLQSQVTGAKVLAAVPVRRSEFAA